MCRCMILNQVLVIDYGFTSLQDSDMDGNEMASHIPADI
ncbi:hypothetical protein IMCC3135_13000 [Granulosicoccus antarcticus IMCC3135]|uniref:Uncharacterized protein n=1 Tax=Granulosicoccus antarcticus IMCC3135 TaxID=1192854 RepID=A0A2Z2NSG6_9GAMM|nr:hypothetical protein IMCC3135_13000 [Granulosicoccus antarcticus IMCC3135]